MILTLIVVVVFPRVISRSSRSLPLKDSRSKGKQVPPEVVPEGSEALERMGSKVSKGLEPFSKTIPSPRPCPAGLYAARLALDAGLIQPRFWASLKIAFGPVRSGAKDSHFPGITSALYLLGALWDHSSQSS